MLKINDMEIEIHRTTYNKTVVQEDGITHIVDPTPHTVYQFGMGKNYFDIEDKSDVTRAIISDLRATALYLEQLLDKDKEKDEANMKQAAEELINELSK